MIVFIALGTLYFLTYGYLYASIITTVQQRYKRDFEGLESRIYALENRVAVGVKKRKMMDE